MTHVYLLIASDTDLDGNVGDLVVAAYTDPAVAERRRAQLTKSLRRYKRRVAEYISSGRILNPPSLPRRLVTAMQGILEDCEFRVDKVRLVDSLEDGKPTSR